MAHQWRSSSSFHTQTMERGRGCPLTSLEPRTSDRVLVLGEGFLGKLKLALDLVEGFLGELKRVLDLVEGFLEELKLVLVLVEFFCLLVQQLCSQQLFCRLQNAYRTISHHYIFADFSNVVSAIQAVSFQHSVKRRLTTFTAKPNFS
jgi:hypothetical protein